MSSKGVRTNRLAGQTSPYLLQHASNPVDWYPWGPEALERAKREDKPILLSIGYAACHWCHVMERESFEDPETAALMNEHFVSIKVDREERPDLDAIYMDAAQALSGGGGWPLTAFLTPDGEPFYAGTYFPPEPRHGLPSFGQVLAGIAGAWRDRREEALDQGRRVIQAIGRAGATKESVEEPDESLLDEATVALRAAFDPRWGGFGGAPKFPQPMTLEFLLRMHLRGAPDVLDMVVTTLERMADGGIHDQLGGGFARYSTDAAWHVPHFEKMLYDNAQLARAYVRAWQVTGRPRFREVAVGTLEYLLREMRHPEGGFLSSQDADSEGEEGKFFTWTYDEVASVAGAGVAAALGAAPGGNWEGTNVLWTPIAPRDVAGELGIPLEELLGRIAEGKARLLEARERRVRPATDDKVLAGWNGLAIGAFAEAGRAFDEARFVEAAVAAAEFALAHLRDGSGRLLRSWRDGTAGGPGYLEDHANLADAFLTLYETTFEQRWFVEARRLCDETLRLFRDQERGGFFQTGSDVESLVIRPKELFDNAVPSGNSTAADVLFRLSLLTGELDYERAALSALRLVRDLAGRMPTAFSHALCAMWLTLTPVREVAIVGDTESADTQALVREVTINRHLPNHVLAVASAEEAPRAEIELLRDRTPRDGVATAYVCERFTCELPVTEPEALVEQLTGETAGAP